MNQILLWTYISNLVFLSCHEIDSAYWKEWKLFGIKNESAIQGFVIFHVPVLFIFMAGIIWLYEENPAGLIMSLIMSFSGIFAFFFHFYHLIKGRKEFNNITSKVILIIIGLASLFQAYLTLLAFKN